MSHTLPLMANATAPYRGEGIRAPAASLTDHSQVVVSKQEMSEREASSDPTPPEEAQEEPPKNMITPASDAALPSVLGRLLTQHAAVPVYTEGAHGLLAQPDGVVVSLRGSKQERGIERRRHT